MIIVFLIFSLFLFDLTLINLINSDFSSILLSFPSSSIFFFFFYFLAFFSLTFYSFFFPLFWLHFCTFWSSHLSSLPPSLYLLQLLSYVINFPPLSFLLSCDCLSYNYLSSFLPFICTFFLSYAAPPSLFLPFLLFSCFYACSSLSSPPSLFLSSSFPPPLPLFSFLSIPSPSLSLQISTCLR